MANVSVLNTTNQLSGKTVAVCENDQTVSGAWTFTGNQTFNGNVTVGNAVTDTLTITSTITSNLLFTDATYDIGASGATRPRDFFLSRNATVGGTLGVTGLTTVTGGLTIPSAAIFEAVRRTCEGRLTLTSGTPVTVTDVTAAGTIYFTPYNGNKISIFDGTNWKLYTFTERSLALTASSGTPYDVFIYDNAGTLTLETTAWTNTTTRATALTTQDGVYVKSGATTRRYLGTFYANGANTTEDSERCRLVWNNHNRVRRSLKRIDTTNTWTYTTASWRQANNSASNQVEVMVGLREDSIEVNLTAISENTSANILRRAVVDRDSATSGGSGIAQGLAFTGDDIGASIRARHDVSVREIPPLGYHYYAWQEYSAATGTTTWAGDSGDVVNIAGLFGSWMA